METWSDHLLHSFTESCVRLLRKCVWTTFWTFISRSVCQTAMKACLDHSYTKISMLDCCEIMSRPLAWILSMHQCVRLLWICVCTTFGTFILGSVCHTGMKACLDHFSDFFTEISMSDCCEFVSGPLFGIPYQGHCVRLLWKRVWATLLTLFHASMCHSTHQCVRLPWIFVCPPLWTWISRSVCQTAVKLCLDHFLDFYLRINVSDCYGSMLPNALIYVRSPTAWTAIEARLCLLCIVNGVP